MIYLKLFWEFLKIGLFSFGGAYGAIPIIKEAVLAQGWMDADTLSAMLAVSESTPGPIMVNSATYIGNQQAGILGAFLATFAVVLPAFLIILLFAVKLKNVLENRYAKALLSGIAPSLMGIIFATGFFMVLSDVFGSLQAITFDLFALIIFAVLLAASFLTKQVFRKKLSPIVLILISAALGIAFYL